MAESVAEKTEQPTAKRLQEAREKGQVALSKEIVSTALLAVLSVVSGLLLIRLATDIRDVIHALGTLNLTDFSAALHQIGFKVLRLFAIQTLILCAFVCGTAILFHLLQTGLLWTFEPLKPQFSKLNPAEGLKRLCSVRNGFEFLKNTFKVLFLSCLLYRLIETSLPNLLTCCYGTLADLQPVIRHVFKRLTLVTLSGYALIALIDWFFQKRHHRRQLMMTKAEVKREMKEMEISQEIRRAQRTFAQEIIQQPLLRQGIKRATVIVTNPTHIAVGLRYVPEETPLPQVTVMGVDRVAAIIRRIAAEENIPLVERVPLARALYACTAVDDYIPETLIEPVAEVLKWVNELAQAQREAEELEQVTLD